MAGRALRKTALLFAVVVVAACGGGGPSPSGGTSPGATSSAGVAASSSAGPASSGTQPVLQAATAIEQVVYFLEGDSTGTTPASGTTILLMFEPGGRAVLYITDNTDRLGHHGTWRYEGGRLSLKFTAEDFKPDETFDLKLDDATVQMPFAVFDTVPGMSTWKRGSLSLFTKTNIVFHADAADADSTLSPDEAIDEAVAVAQGMIGSSDPDDVLPLAARAQPAIALAAMRREASDVGLAEARREFDPKPPTIKDVTRLNDGLHVEYENAPGVDVALFDMSAEPTTYISLVPGPIASDPRVRLDPEPSGHSDDPVSKTAVLISPFNLRRYPGGLWTAFAPNKLVKWVGANPGAISGHTSFDWLEGANAQLSKHGYKVTEVLDEEATLPNIITALGGPSGTAPGVVMIQTHGGSTGNLTTGVDLGQAGDLATVNKNFAAAVEEVAKIAPDLITFEGGTAAHPKTIDKTGISYAKDEFHGDFFLALTPAFWRWLKSHGVRFDNSLVYLAACSTDATPDLREAISAKAYFAWSGEVYASLDGAVASYIVDSMVRPTHTAEEAYYNIARIVGTGQRIYDEDQDFVKSFAVDIPKGSQFLDFFRGYGWDGSKLVPYATNGWFDRVMNPGNVWWLVFAGRWDNKAGDGAAALVGCEQTYWQKGERAGLRDAFCNSAAPGGLPLPDEVAYATFVLTGKKVLPYSGTPVPRMTLVDGQS
jgi:hypothetical protein